MAFLGVLLILVVAGTPTAAASPQQWHRNNYNTEHERLTCREGVQSWTCIYDKVPEEGLNWDASTNWFSGRNVTAAWTCPEWFGSTICDNVTAVYEGVAAWRPDGGRPFTVREDYILTNIDGQEVLYIYWIDQFVCPWYRTYDEALAADFNCIFAP